MTFGKPIYGGRGVQSRSPLFVVRVSRSPSFVVRVICATRFAFSVSHSQFAIVGSCSARGHGSVCAPLNRPLGMCVHTCVNIPSASSLLIIFHALRNLIEDKHWIASNSLSSPQLKLQRIEDGWESE